MARIPQNGSFKRYNKVLGAKVERILRVRRNRSPRSEVPHPESTPSDLYGPSAADETDALSKKIEVLRIPLLEKVPRRVVSRTCGVTIAFFQEHMEISLDNPKSPEQARKLTDAIRSLAQLGENLRHCSIDIRALHELSNPMVEALCDLQSKLYQQNRTLGLIVDEQRHIFSESEPGAHQKNDAF